MDSQKHSWFSGQLILGLAFMILGILFLLDNAGIIEIGPVWSIWRYWPLVLVVAGIGKFINANNRKGQIEGVWMIFIGSWLFASFEHILGLTFRTSWPLIIIAWGITILWKGMIKPSEQQIVSGEPHGQ